jgi:hypothetical protein
LGIGSARSVLQNVFVRRDVIYLYLDVFGEVAHRVTPQKAAERDHASRNFLHRVLTGHPTKTPEFLRGPRGKPGLAEGPEFNMSHSGGITAVAVSGQAVGIDIELTTRRPHVRPLAEKFFHTDEVNFLVRHDWSPREFLRMWVRKEALCKLAGDGIYAGLRDAASGMCGKEAFYGGQAAFIHEFGAEHGLCGAIATFEPAMLEAREAPSSEHLQP